MKIAIIGTHSTGKTTIGLHLQRALVELGHKAIQLPEMARICPFPINEGTTLEAQQWILENQIKHEAHMHQDGVFLICDRSTIDNFAYLDRVAPADIIQKHLPEAVQHMQSYDAIFKTQRLDLNAKKDGVRSTDKQFRDEIDNKILSLLEEHNILFHHLPQSTEYIAHVEHILEKIFSENQETESLQIQTNQGTLSI